MDKINNEANDFDSLVDDFYEKQPEEGVASSAIPEEPKTDEDPGAEPAKTEQVKDVEEDVSLTTEDRIEKIKEILGDDQDAIDAYVKEKGYHTDPAWIKQREKIDRLNKEVEAKSALSEEDRAAIEEVKKFRSSAEYIQMQGKAEGFTQEAIDRKLLEAGHTAQGNPEDEINLIIDKLGLDAKNVKPETRAIIEDVAKIASIIVSDKLGKVLPKELAPLKENIESNEQSKNASTILTAMQGTVKSEGILDFTKDIEPLLHKFMDENPGCLQPDVKAHFDSIYHQLTVERLKIGNKQKERDGIKGDLRQNIPTAGSPGGVPKKTGNFENDADAFLDTLNVS